MTRGWRFLAGGALVILSGLIGPGPFHTAREWQVAGLGAMWGFGICWMFGCRSHNETARRAAGDEEAK